MPLNLATSDADFIPYLKYNAKAGRFYVRPKGASEDVEVMNPRLAFDMANIKTGWLFYQEGAGPEKVWDPSLTTPAPRPVGPKKFKRGFEVFVFGNDDLPVIGRLELREFSSTAGNVTNVINAMYTAYEAGMAANPGKVPFYKCDGVKPVVGAYGTNYEPQFRLIAWIDRTKIPAFDEHVEKPAAPVAPAPQAAPPNGSNGYHAPIGGAAKVDPLLNDEIPF